MGQPLEKTEQNFPPTRNRKRILEASEENDEEENHPRRQTHPFEWNETLKSIGVPSKKGFLGNESQYNEMIDQGLADNFEDSLSGLGVDITTSSYNMSDAMLALPNVCLLKADPFTMSHKLNAALENVPSNLDDSSQSSSTERLLKLLSTDGFGNDVSPSCVAQSLQHLLQVPHIFADVATTSSNADVSANEERFSLEASPSDYDASESPTHLSTVISPCAAGLYENNNRFQYILGAATSIAVKIAEDGLTYLNQSQSYEIKIKKLGDITGCQGRLFRSRICLCFHERRLQYIQKEEMAAWQQNRPDQRILEIDVPLSYGISDVVQDPKQLHVCEFNWDPTKEVGLYIKVNCISTEFTPKKHGGEKGVPFRLQIETFSHCEDQNECIDRLHACGCQVKIFRLKGADRKHKQDREKINKKAASDAIKYQKQCDCTILQDINAENLHPVGSENESATSGGATPSTSSAAPSAAASPVPTPSKPINQVLPEVNTSPGVSKSIAWENLYRSNVSTQESPKAASKSITASDCVDPIWSASEVCEWLTLNRFDKHLDTLANFAGLDLLRLTRNEMLEICGLVDGIRLFNAARTMSVWPKLTVYVRMEKTQPFHAVYLRAATLAEFTRGLAMVARVDASSVHDIYVQGPGNINVLVTDEVVRNFKNESTYMVETFQHSSAEMFRILLRQCSSSSHNSPS